MGIGCISRKRNVLISSIWLCCLCIFFQSSAFAESKSNTVTVKYVICPGSGEKCPMTDLKFSDFPGVIGKENSPNEGFGFSRNQDTVGHCDFFQGVDLICYQLKKLGKWQGSDNCSVLDFELWVYKKDIAEKHKTGNMEDFLSGDKNITEDGVTHKKLQYSRKELEEYAHTVGFCPESRFRSEFQGNYGSSNYNTKNFLMETNTKFSSGQTEAGVGETGYCPECELVSKFNIDWKQINEELKKKNSGDPKYNAFVKMNDLACPNSVRVKLPAEYEIDIIGSGIKTRDYVDYVLSRKNLVGISIGPKILHPDVASKPTDSHAAIIAYAYCDKENSSSNNERCYYGIKNSWGMNCLSMKDTTERKCDKKNGSVLLTWDTLSKGIDDFNIKSIMQKDN